MSRLPLPQVERRYFWTKDDARIAYYVSGSPGAPPLVISAGLGGGIRAWSALITRLAPRFRIYAWDYRGLYASITPDEPPRAHELTLVRHAADLAELLEHLDLARERRPILAGWSMGVQVNFELGRTHPHLARAMIALHGAPGDILETAFDGRGFHQVAPRLFDAMRTYGKLVKGPARQLARSRRFAMGFMGVAQTLGLMDERADPDVFFDMARDWVKLDLSTYATIFEHLGEHDVRGLLPELRAPTLVVAGGEDPFTPLRLSEEMVRLLPDAELVVLPDATHFGPLEFPDDIAAAILRFAEERDLTC